MEPRLRPYGGSLDEVLGEGRTERLRERLAHRIRATSEEAVGKVVRRVRGEDDAADRDDAGPGELRGEP
jgi:hypothetical protein